jgi:protein SCO1/2
MKHTLIITTACLFSACLTSCDSKKQTAESPAPSNPEVTATPVATQNDQKSCCSEHPSPAAAAASSLSADSIYQINSKWRDQGNHERTLKSLGGRIQVVTMGYSTCKFACPRLLADMRLIESGLPKDIAAKTGFTFISIDPETDTPARLSEYQKDNKIDPARWSLLTGETSSVQELAVVLGIQYRKVDAKDFAHSNLITVLNAKGEIIHRQEGLAADPAATIKAIIDAQ